MTRDLVIGLHDDVCHYLLFYDWRPAALLPIRSDMIQPKLKRQHLYLLSLQIIFGIIIAMLEVNVDRLAVLVVFYFFF